MNRSKDLDYNYIASDIAKQISESSIYDQESIARKVKAILKASVDRGNGDRDFSKLVIKCQRQSVALNRKEFELNYWKNKVHQKEQYFEELHKLLKEKGL